VEGLIHESYLISDLFRIKIFSAHKTRSVESIGQALVKNLRRPGFLPVDNWLRTLPPASYSTGKASTCHTEKRTTKRQRDSY
jgi:hypothetical protein